MNHSGLNHFLLAASTPDPDPRLIPLLRSSPALAASQDHHGYSLLHAAASYNHVNLLKTLVHQFGVAVNLVDEDGETCLFVAETEPVARCLVEELKIDTSIQNREGVTARVKIRSEDEWPQVMAYLDQQATRSEVSSESLGQKEGIASNGDDSVHLTHPPPLPPNMRLDLSTTTEAEINGDGNNEPDPEFRKRIEELAAKEDFQSEENQQELRELILDAVRGLNGRERDGRRRAS